MGNPIRVDEVVAVQKKLEYTNGRPSGNNLELLSTRHLTEKTVNYQIEPPVELTVI